MKVFEMKHFKEFYESLSGSDKAGMDFWSESEMTDAYCSWLEDQLPQLLSVEELNREADELGLIHPESYGDVESMRDFQQVVEIVKDILPADEEIEKLIEVAKNSPTGIISQDENGNWIPQVED